MTPNTILAKGYSFLIIFVLLTFLCISFTYLGMSSSLTNNIFPRENETIDADFPPDKKGIINRFEYSYPINVENACNEVDRLLLFMPVNSAVTNFNRRNETRHRRQKQFLDKKGNSARLLFFVGLPSAKLVSASLYQKRVEAEAEKYGDIIQINVVETYRNLTLKAVGTLHWIVKYCSNSKFILKLDDDVDVNPTELLRPLTRRKKKSSNFVVGTMGVRLKPVRNKAMRDYVSEEDYQNSTYPPFVYGPVEGFPTSTAILLYQQALKTKMMPLDDVFVTGMCRQALGIPVFHHKQYMFKYVLKKMDAPNFVFSK